jgi:hypothetical protein
MTAASATASRPAVAALLVVVGLALSLGGFALARNSLATDDLIERSNLAWRGVVSLSITEMTAMIDTLRRVAGERPTADEAAALTFLHSVAASQAAIQRDAATWRQELRAARVDALKALASAPTRADVALSLAEAEFLLGAGDDVVDKAIRVSFEVAPRELWIVQRRILLGLRLIANAPPDIRLNIARDVGVMGEPSQNLGYYRGLASAAFLAGPAAVVFVRSELSVAHEQPLALFNAYLAELEAVRDANAQSKPN